MPLGKKKSEQSMSSFKISDLGWANFESKNNVGLLTKLSGELTEIGLNEKNKIR